MKKIVHIVSSTYGLQYSLEELKIRKLNVPILVLKAQGDDYSFIENKVGLSANTCHISQLAANHYSVLKEPDINKLVNILKAKQASLFRQVKYLYSVE